MFYDGDCHCYYWHHNYCCCATLRELALILSKSPTIQLNSCDYLSLASVCLAAQAPRLPCIWIELGMITESALSDHLGGRFVIPTSHPSRVLVATSEVLKSTKTTMRMQTEATVENGGRRRDKEARRTRGKKRGAVRQSNKRVVEGAAAPTN